MSDGTWLAQTPTLQTSTDMEPLTHAQALRLAGNDLRWIATGHGCGTASDSHRLPLRRTGVRNRRQHPGCQRPLPDAYGTSRPKPGQAWPVGHYAMRNTSPLHAVTWLLWAV
ncbi:MAG: hypothetical protein QOD45_497, partial [Pseudonocardiales bacterium]|nr:hypothetical protein [Pseudonocardiales bacterium]